MKCVGNHGQLSSSSNFHGVTLHLITRFLASGLSLINCARRRHTTHAIRRNAGDFRSALRLPNDFFRLGYPTFNSNGRSIRCFRIVCFRPSLVGAYGIGSFGQLSNEW